VPTIDEILSDLRAEYSRLDAILDGLTNAEWNSPSDAPGWTICDVVIHLAVSEEGVATSIGYANPTWTNWDGAMDDAIAVVVAENRAEPADAFARWRAATTSSVQALGAADPKERVSWAAAPLRPGSLATTRLAEHWAHALDISVPLGIDLPDTDRLRHIAWLGHRTIPYGCDLIGVEAQPVRVELTSPDGELWGYGPTDAESRIMGSAGDFCRVGAQRLSPAESGLVAEGPFANQALAVLRNYAA
jgi:uncharacterized protein (TIGR03084 family)